MEEMHKRYCSKIVVEKEYMGHIGIDGRMIKYPWEIDWKVTDCLQRSRDRSSVFILWTP